MDSEFELSKDESLLVACRIIQATTHSAKGPIELTNDRNDSSNESHGRANAFARDIRSPERDSPYDDELREACDKSLRVFLEECCKNAFPLAWSPDHLDVIDILQRVATDGGLFTLAMPRGSGKTTISVRAALWAILTGRRSYIEVVASTESSARKIIRSIKSEVTYNKELRLLYPAEMHGLWQLKGDNRKAGGQICHGEKTGVNLGTNEIIFPTHQYSKVGGSVVYAAGLTGQIRGPNYPRQDGSVIRPDMVILDDPQDREAATSATQVEDRIQIVEGDVLGLAGPGQSIAAVMPCTVIAKKDLADHFLKHPQWQAKLAKMLYSFPTDMTIWDRYFEIRAEEQRVHGTHDAANEFYTLNREAMDAGARVGWEDRKQPEEVSAIQSAMHLWYRSPSAFAAEYNNEPLDASLSLDAPTFSKLTDKLTGLERSIVPVWATKLTLGIDVQQRALFWVVCAWSEDFTGSIIDYGAWPRQSRAYFGLQDINPTLQQASGHSQLEAAIRWGLDGLTNELLRHQWVREGGGNMTIGKVLVDANWGSSTDCVYEFCRRSTFAAMIVPSHGMGITAGGVPLTQKAKKTGEQHGWNWILTPGSNTRAIRHVNFDSNFWKTTMAERASAAAGEKGALSVFGHRPESHKMLMDHLESETTEQTSGRGRSLWEWSNDLKRENHWLDCLVLCGVAASMAGCAVDGIVGEKEPQRRAVSIPKHLLRRN